MNDVAGVVSALVPALVVHIVLAWALFRLVNWLDIHSSAFGYVSLRPRPQADVAPAFNVALRAGTPLAFLLLISAALYGIGADPWMRNIWWVVPLYFVGRISLNVWVRHRVGLGVTWGALLRSTSPCATLCSSRFPFWRARWRLRPSPKGGAWQSR